MFFQQLVRVHVSLCVCVCVVEFVISHNEPGRAL